MVATFALTAMCTLFAADSAEPITESQVDALRKTVAQLADRVCREPFDESCIPDAFAMATAIRGALAAWRPALVAGEGPDAAAPIPRLECRARINNAREVLALRAIPGVRFDLWLGSTPISDAELTHIAKLPGVSSTMSNGPWNVKPETFALLREMRDLEEFSLHQITNEQVVMLAEVKTLKNVSIGCKDLDAAVLSYLSKLPKLDRLGLFNPPLSDEDVKHFIGFADGSLRSIFMTGSSLSPEGEKLLAKTLPRVRIAVMDSRGPNAVQLGPDGRKPGPAGPPIRKVN